MCIEGVTLLVTNVLYKHKLFVHQSFDHTSVPLANTSFDGVELSEVRDTGVKHRECLDSSVGTQTSHSPQVLNRWSI